MTPTALYSLAIANVGTHDGNYGAARVELGDGSTLICFTNAVAGRSIVAKHRRTTWHLIKAGDKYSKTISKKRASDLLAK